MAFSNRTKKANMRQIGEAYGDACIFLMFLTYLLYDWKDISSTQTILIYLSAHFVSLGLQQKEWVGIIWESNSSCKEWCHLVLMTSFKGNLDALCWEELAGRTGDASSLSTQGTRRQTDLALQNSCKLTSKNFHTTTNKTRKSGKNSTVWTIKQK